MIKIFSKAKNKASKLLEKILNKEKEIKFNFKNINKENWDFISEIPVNKIKNNDYLTKESYNTFYYEDLLKKISYTKHSKKKEKLIKKKKQYEKIFGVSYENK